MIRTIYMPFLVANHTGGKGSGHWCSEFELERAISFDQFETDWAMGLVKSCLSKYRGKKLVTVVTATAVGAPTLHRFGFPRAYFFTPRIPSFAALEGRS